jgi:hypothetical protein
MHQEPRLQANSAGLRINPGDEIMSYLPSTASLVFSSGQSTGDAGALIAAAAGFLGTVIGAAVAVIGARIAAQAEDRREERRLAAEQLNLQEAHRENLERK